jgi:hypothetical protein
MLSICLDSLSDIGAFCYLHSKALKEGPVDIIEDRIISFHRMLQSREESHHQKTKGQLVPGT